jgi:cytochrome c5
MKKRRVESGLIVLLLLAGCTSGETGMQAATLPDPGSPGAVLVMTNCTACHGAPMPSSHPAKEWPAVVARMQNWRVTKGFDAIPGKDVKPLLDYLESHGGQG